MNAARWAVAQSVESSVNEHHLGHPWPDYGESSALSLITASFGFDLVLHPLACLNITSAIHGLIFHNSCFERALLKSAESHE